MTPLPLGEAFLQKQAIPEGAKLRTSSAGGDGRVCSLPVPTEQRGDGGPSRERNSSKITQVSPTSTENKREEPRLSPLCVPPGRAYSRGQTYS